MIRKKFNAAGMVEFCTREQMEEFHSAALELLQDTGMEIQHKGAIQMLKDAGCYVKRKRVHFPPSLVEWALKSAPSHIKVYDRNGRMTMDLGAGNVYFGTGSDCVGLYNWETKTHEAFSEQDLIDGYKIADACENIDFLMCLGLLYQYPKTNYEHQFYLMMTNSGKPMVVTAADRDCIEHIFQMAAIVRGGEEELRNKPLFILYDEPTSPMNHTYTAVDKLIYCAENMIPTNYSPGIMFGATGPMSVEGTLVLAIAECLAGLVINQLAKPGAPFVFGSCSAEMDMKCMQPTYSSPYTYIFNGVIGQMGKEFYHLPTWSMGGSTGSKIPDAQALSDATQQAYMAALTGNNLNHDVGFMNYGLTFSYELLVMMEEVIAEIRAMFKGIDSEEIEKSVELIKEIGPKGNYLAEEHTIYHLKRMWNPKLMDRNDYVNWQKKGSLTLEERAHEKVLDLIAHYEPEQLPEKIQKKVEDYLREIDQKAL